MDRDRLNKGNILQVNFQGDVVATWKSVREITDALGCHSGNLSLCLRHKNSIHKGFVWVYESDKHLIPEKIANIKWGKEPLCLEGEEWRDVKDFEGWYQVSNMGRVKSLKRPCDPCDLILKAAIKEDGYLKVALYGGKAKGKNMLVHRLVAEAFIPNPDKLPLINHKDECKTNNVVSNLEWCTYRYNTLYSPSIGCTLNRYDMSLPVLQFSKEGEFIKEYPSVAEAARQLGVSETSISYACRGKVKLSHGFAWSYAVQKIQDGLSPKDIESVNRILLAFSQNSCKIIAPMVGKFENAIQRIFGKDLFSEE